MPRYLWHLDADGWPLERINTLTGEHVPVFTGGPEESLHLQVGGRPMACSVPKVSGVVWVFGGYAHQVEG
ncbi:hypothetical protein [Synechococcus sp. BO 8801]|uniref:hypothetical protein n=1 Tax=Synechococcus sp. BO 8801 TaxID=169670 RepID=UPI000B995340|nr:hypothetical protein [Synechococcus sp. BO 8801]